MVAWRADSDSRGLGYPAIRLALYLQLQTKKTHSEKELSNDVRLSSIGTVYPERSLVQRMEKGTMFSQLSPPNRSTGLLRTSSVCHVIHS